MANADLTKLLKKVAEVTSSTVNHSEDIFHRKNDNSTIDASNKKKMGPTQTYDHLITNEYDRETHESKLTELEAQLATQTSDHDLCKNKSNEKRKMEREAALAELAKRRQDSANKKALAIATSWDAANAKSLTTTASNSGYHDTMMVEFETGTFATFEEIKEIIVTKEKLLEWYKEPFFDKLIAGCFVRLNIGVSSRGVNVYRLCLVRNADATSPCKSYKFKKEDTYMYLNLVWGNEYASARWKMACVSDVPPTKKEFDEWAHEVKRHMGYWPTKRDVLAKKEDIRRIMSSLVVAAPQIVTENYKVVLWRPPIANERSGMEMVMFAHDNRKPEGSRSRGPPIANQRPGMEMVMFEHDKCASEGSRARGPPIANQRPRKEMVVFGHDKRAPDVRRARGPPIAKERSGMEMVVFEHVKCAPDGRRARGPPIANERRGMKMVVFEHDKRALGERRARTPPIANKRPRTKMVIFEEDRGEPEGRRARGGREIDEKAIKLAELNKKNKMENFKNGSRKKAMHESFKDPFSRRWTRPRNCYYANATIDDNNARGNADVAVDKNAGPVVDEEDIDLRALHDFDLPISLDKLERFGGAQSSYLANKQRVEGAIGVKVPKDDGTMHRKTMTVDDYMRRRGLL